MKKTKQTYSKSPPYLNPSNPQITCVSCVVFESCTTVQTNGTAKKKKHAVELRQLIWTWYCQIGTSPVQVQSDSWRPEYYCNASACVAIPVSWLIVNDFVIATYTLSRCQFKSLSCWWMRVEHIVRDHKKAHWWYNSPVITWTMLIFRQKLIFYL